MLPPRPSPRPPGDIQIALGNFDLLAPGDNLQDSDRHRRAVHAPIPFRRRNPLDALPSRLLVERFASVALHQQRHEPLRLPFDFAALARPSAFGQAQGLIGLRQILAEELRVLPSLSWPNFDDSFLRLRLSLPLMGLISFHGFSPWRGAAPGRSIGLDPGTLRARQALGRQPQAPFGASILALARPMSDLQIANQ